MKDDILTTNEILGNVFCSGEFRCPFCNSDKVVDNMDYKRWECKECRKNFAQPIQIYDEGIPMDKVWISKDFIMKWLDELDTINQGYGEYDICNPSEIPYSESFEGSDFEKIQMISGKIMTHIDIIKKEILNKRYKE